MDCKPNLHLINKLFSILLLASLLLSNLNINGSLPVHAAGSILHVVPAGLTSGPCDTWAAACNLQYALSTVVPGEDVWVEQGIYKPTDGADRSVSFVLLNDVGIYGGFAGTEALQSERDPAAHVTILSGDIGAGGDATDNSYHVVFSSLNDSSAVLDGFTITAGNTNGGPGGGGGGMAVVNGSPTLANLIITGNHAQVGGGGMNNNNSSPNLTNVTFSGNIADDSGGGMMNYNNSSPSVTHVNFIGNSANGTDGGAGGGMDNELNSSPTLTDVIFDGNSSADSGGGMLNCNNGNPSLTNVTFSNNTAQYGGGLYDCSSNPTLMNVSFNGNTATSDAGPFGGGMANDHSSPALTNVTFTNNSATGANSQGGGMWNANTSSPTLTNVTFTNNSATGGVSTGGGMWNSSSNPTLTNVTFTNNRAIGSVGSVNGGGIFNINSNPTLTSVTFSGNAAGNSGGGMYNGNSMPTLMDVIFDSNTAKWGGGMSNLTSSPALTRVTFSGNSTSMDGGGMFNGTGSPTLTNVTFNGNTAGRLGGAMYNEDASAPTMTNVTFSGNHADDSGGGMYNWNGTPTFTNVTFGDNTASVEGAGIYNDDSPSGPSNAIISDSIFWGSGSQIFNAALSAPIITDSIVSGGCPSHGICTNVIGADPLLGALANNGGNTQTRALSAGSAAIDAGGANSTCAATDQRGVTRPQGPACDIGAYELEGGGPTIAVEIPNNLVMGDGWTEGPGITFTLTVDNPTNGVGVDYTRQSSSINDFDLFDFPLKPGYIVTMTDGTTTRSVVVIDQNINVDYGNSTVSGVTSQNMPMWVMAWCNGTRYVRHVSPLANVQWTADFSTPGIQPDEQTTVSLDYGCQHIKTQQFYPNGNSSGYEWPYRSGSQADPMNDWVSAEMWPPDTHLVLDIDDPSNGAGVDYTTSLDVGQPDGNGQTNTSFDLGNFDLVPGDVVTITASTYHLQYTIDALETTSVDLDHDIVHGMAHANDAITVYGSPDGNWAAYGVRRVTAGSDGSWSVDFSQPVSGGRFEEQVVVDLTALSSVDADINSHTEVHWPTQKTRTVNALGGSVFIPTVDLQVPSGAVSSNTDFTLTDGGSGFQVTSNQGALDAVTATTIGPEGTTFSVPATITFNWPDDDNNGIVDNTNIHETGLYLSKNGVVIAGPCSSDPRCDMINNSFTVQVSSLSYFVIGALSTNNPPVVNPASFSVNETATNGTSVGTVTYSDPDSGQNHICSIRDGNIGDAFAINIHTCEIVVNDHTELDINARPTYNLTIRVTDDGDPVRHGDAAITIHVVSPSCHTLTLSHTGNGSDPVATPANSPECTTGNYTPGQNIALSSVAPGNGWQVGSWTGTNDDTSTASSNTVSMPASNHTSSVNYTQNVYTLTVTSAHGTVNRNNPGPYHYGDVVQLTSVPDAGWSFANWSGDATGTTNPVAVTMNGNKSVTANYTAITYTISGNAGIAGATLSYTDGAAKTATSQADGSYSLTVSYNWNGAVTPSLACYTFSPANRSYSNVTSDQLAKNYIPTVGLGCASVNVSIAGTSQGTYVLPPKDNLRPSYAGGNNGPVRVTSSNGTNIIASERVAYTPDGGTTWTDFSELMGLPSGQLTTSYVMPWYNNVDLNTQLRFGNVGSTATNVTVKVAGAVQGIYPVAPSQSMRISYAGLNNGPVQVTSSGGMPIIASERVAYYDGSAWTSFSELMGLPSGQLTTSYVMPWYNNVDLNSQLRFGNVGSTATTVTVKVAGVVQGNYPLAANQSARVSYAGLNNGPVQITSTGGVPIIASERVTYYNGSAWTSFAELMGLPSSQLTTSYALPVYDNVSLNTQLRFGNVGSTSTSVTVTVGGVLQGTYTLIPSQSVRISYAGLNDGPVVVSSSGGVPIIVSDRVAYYNGSAWTSFAEMMGLPATQLTTSYVMPWYNNVDLNTQLRFAVP